VETATAASPVVADDASDDVSSVIENFSEAPKFPIEGGPRELQVFVPQIIPSANCGKSKAVIVFYQGDKRYLFETGFAIFGPWHEMINKDTATASPLNACSPLTKKYSGGIVLAQRGQCYFYIKVKCSGGGSRGRDHLQ
jgi:hypothetical protein